MRAGLVLLAALVVAVSGCGDDGPSPAEREAQQRLELWRAGAAPSACVEFATPRLVRSLYGSTGNCLKRTGTVFSGRDAFDVLRVTVRGSSATARVRLKTAGAPVEADVELRDGSRGWQVDAVGTDFVRATLARRLTTAAGQDVLRAPAARACLVRQLDALPDGRLLRLARDSRGVEAGSAPQAVRLLRRCPEVVTDELVRVADEELTPGRTAAKRRCVRRGVRRLTRPPYDVVTAVLEGRTTVRTSARSIGESCDYNAR